MEMESVGAEQKAVAVRSWRAKRGLPNTEGSRRFTTDVAGRGRLDSSR